MENINGLLLAVEVRKIALELRDRARLMDEAKAARNSALQFNKFQWDAEHSVKEFVPQALAELIDVDAIISAQPPAV